MFSKASSSLGGSKKKMDVPVRKSDRRKLRDKAVTVLDGDSNTALLMASVFMQDSLVLRKVVLPQYKIELYLRGPSSPEAASSKEEDATITTWPYTTTTECVWMSIDAGPGEPPLDVPSVALLSLLPQFPCVVVHYHVSKFLCRGADLMRAGMMSVPESVATTGGIVGVKVHGNPQPFCVGIYRPGVEGETGVGVSILSCYGDDLYQNTTAAAASTSKSSMIVNPVGGAPFDNGHYGNVGFLEGALVRPIQSVPDSDDSDDEDETVEEDNEETAVEGEATPDDTTAGGDESPTLVPEDTPTPPDEVPTVPDTETLDEMLHLAACRALVNLKDSKDLPMLAASFYANHVLKHRAEDDTIQLKQTSYKKFGTYLLHQQARGLLKLSPDPKDANNPAGMLQSVNRRHEDFRGISKTPASAANTPTKMAIVTLFMIPHHFVNLLRLDPDEVKATNAKSEARRGTGGLTTPEARAILEHYCESNDLVSADRMDVTLDGPLTDALYKKSAKNTPTNLSRKELADAWMAKLEPAYALVQMPGSKIVQLARGAPPKVTLEVSMRQGRKFITRVRGMEDYGIDGAELVSNVTKRFACNGSIEDEETAIGTMGHLKKGHVQVVFQGHLLEELKALLIGDAKLSSHGGAKGSKYCVPKQAITVSLKRGVPAKKRK